MNDAVNKSPSFDPHRGWVAWFARNPVAANLLMLSILVVGALSALNIRVEDFPSMPPDSITVEVSYDSGSAATSETGVTIRLEEALNGVPGIKRMHSLSTRSGTTLTIEKTSGYDLDSLYQDVKNRIDSIATLPTEAERPIVSRQLDIEEAVSVHLHGNADQKTMQTLARQLRDRLLANPEIEEVLYNGFQTPEVSIQLDEQQLQTLGLTLADVAERIAASSLITAGGELFSEAGRLVVKADQPRYFKPAFEQILILEQPDGQRIRLGDIARVHDGYEQNGILSRFNGQPAIELAVKMYGNSDIMTVSEQTRLEVDAFRATLPHGLGATVWNDSSVYIKDRLGLLLDNSLMGMALVMLLLSLLLNLRVAFWVGVGLPVTFAGAMILMGPNGLGMSLNELTTFGFIIALGIVVDDAVVVGESVHSERERHGANLTSTIRGAQRVTVPTVFGVLTTVVAFLSLGLVEGRMGRIFSLFAYAAAFCLIFSLIESKLILPAHLAHLKPDQPPGNPISRFWYWLQSQVNRGMQFWIRRLYRPFIHQALKLPYATLLLALALFILVVGMVPSGKIRAVFFPDIPENLLQVVVTLEDDAGYGLVQAHALKLEQLGFEISAELQQAYGLTTPPITQLMTLSDETSATLTVELSPRTERPFSPDLISDRWQARAGQLEATRSLKFVTDNEDDADISVELRATDQASLQQAAQQLQTALAGFAHVSGVQNSMKAARPQVDLQLLPLGEALGLTAEMLARQIQQAYQGYEVQRIQRGRDEVKVKVRYPDHQRRSFDDLNHAYIRLPDGQAIPLLAVAELHSGYVAGEIERINRNRVAVITADVDKAVADADEILEAMENEQFAALRLQYPGLEIALTGEAQEEAEATASLQLAFAAALLAIYGLLAIPLKSYSQPLLIMTAIPFGIIGALLGLWLHDLPLSLLAIFGILALSGVVVNDSLLLISRFNDYRAEGKPVRLAMVEACCNRMRAIILTSLTTYIGLVPLILDNTDSAQALIPAAVSMGYGILFATLITLILIPTLVVIREDLTFSTKKKEQSPAPAIGALNN